MWQVDGAAKDAADRAAVIAALDQQLRRGDKALIGNSAFVGSVPALTAKHVFEIDPGKVADEALLRATHIALRL